MHLRTSQHGPYYLCQSGRCRATHDAHDDGEPTGRPGNKFEKAARTAAHAWFDLIWKNGKMNRSQAYLWMRAAMNISAKQAHIGMFDVEQCDRLVAAVRKFLGV